MSHEIHDPIILPSDSIGSLDVSFGSPLTHIITPVSDPISIPSVVPGTSDFTLITRTEDHSPVAKYFTKLGWGNGFEQWDIVRFNTPMDGSCLFHAIANSFFIPYRKQILRDKSVTQSQIVQMLRQELSQRLGTYISDAPNSPTFYDTLSNGAVAKFAEYVPEFQLAYMQNELNSNRYIGYGYMEFIGNILDKDIYILDGVRRDLYCTDELPFTIKGTRNSIILYYNNGHYELVGLRNKDDTFITHFNPTHTIIRFLYECVGRIIAHQTAL